MPLANEKMEHLKALELPKDASVDDIKAAYKKLALKWHPDRHTDDKEFAAQRFIEVHEAYRILLESRSSKVEVKAPSSSSSTSGKSSESDESSSTATPSATPSSSRAGSRRSSPSPRSSDGSPSSPKSSVRSSLHSEARSRSSRHSSATSHASSHSNARTESGKLHGSTSRNYLRADDHQSQRSGDSVSRRSHSDSRRSEQSSRSSRSSVHTSTSLASSRKSRRHPTDEVASVSSRSHSSRSHSSTKSRGRTSARLSTLKGEEESDIGSPCSTRSSSLASDRDCPSSRHGYDSDACTTPPTTPKPSLPAELPEPEAVKTVSSRGNSSLHVPTVNEPRSRSSSRSRQSSKSSSQSTVCKKPMSDVQKSSRPRLHHEDSSKSNTSTDSRRDATRREDGRHHTGDKHRAHQVLEGYCQGTGASQEWIYPLKLHLEELLRGTKYRFRVTRFLLDGQKKHVVLDVEVPPGCAPGTKILCPSVGHERKDGSLQDVAFIVEETEHEQFTRSGDDLMMDVKMPWVDTLKKQKGEVCFRGLDEEEIVIQIDYPRNKEMSGRHIVVGAGMPIREGGVVVGRGDLVVSWEIINAPESKWQSLKRVLHFSKGDSASTFSASI